MASPSKSLKTFRKTLARSQGLLALYDVIVQQGKTNPKLVPTGAHATDVVRSAVVLGVSGMDAYFTDRFIESLVSYIKAKGPTTGMIEMLGEAGLDTSQALEMATMQRPYRRVRTLVQRHLERYVTQKISKIDDLFAAYRLSDFCANVQARTGRTKLIRSVEILVDRRHRIVHDGDLNNHDRLRAVGAKEVQKRLEDVSTFVEEADTFLDVALK